MVIALLLCLGVLVIYFACVVLLFYFSTFLNYSTTFPASVQILQLEVLIPSFIQILIYYAFDAWVYKNISEILTNFENHKTI